MFSLPGLNLSSLPTDPLNLAASAPTTRTQDLAANTEYRFEVSFSRTVTIKLLSGTAELFGTELGPSTTYSLKGTKGAIFTWHGCKLEIGGEMESEYVGEETTMRSSANAHFALEGLRDQAVARRELGPRVCVVGPENSGKTSLVKILTSYAVKSGRQPVVVNLDPTQGMLAPPGSVSAAAYSSIIDVEDGWGSSPISGPSPVPVKMPLIYHYGMANPEEGKVFKPLATRMALAVTSRLEEDEVCRPAGLIIDTPGSISQGKGGNYDNVEHIISEFSVNVVFVLGSERLYSDLTRKYANRTEDPVHVIKLDKSGGCVHRHEAYMKQLRQAQIRLYFFGSGGETALAPNSHMADFDELHILKVKAESNSSFDNGIDYDVYGNANETIYVKVTPSPEIQNSLLAITSASAKDRQEVIRDSSLRGFLYVVDVDEAKRKVRLLSPQPGQTPSNAIVMGNFPEDVPGLVS